MTATAELCDEQLLLPLDEPEAPKFTWRASHVTPLDPEIAALLLPVPGTSETFAARVFHYIDASGDCWEWTGANKDGYGAVGRGPRGAGNEQTHRAVWQMLVGPIADDLQLDHLCRNHACCNPDHLEPVPAEINKARGFSVAVLYSKRESCALGHPLDGVLGSRGGKRTHRYCKTCARENARRTRVPAPPRTHCKSGKHPWIEENIYTHPKTGSRTCKPCAIERQRETRAAAKLATSKAA